MERLALPLGHLDTSTPEAVLPDPRRAGPRLRDAAGVVPDPSGFGYLVPPTAERSWLAPAGRVALDAAWYGRARHGDGANKAANLTRVAVVTDQDLRIVTPGGADVVAHTYDVPDQTRVGQFAPLGDSLFVTSESAGQPERPLALRDDVALPYDGARWPWMPDVTDFSITNINRGSTSVGGLTFGVYAVRFAAVRRDGSLGPGGLPTIHVVSRLTYAYDLQTTTAATDTTVTLNGGFAVVDFNQLLPTYPGGVPVYIAGAGRFLASDAEESGGNSILTLDRAIGVIITNGNDKVDLGDRASLQVTTASDLNPPDLTNAERDSLFRGVAVLISAPLGSSDNAGEAPYFRVGELRLDAATAYDTGDLTTAELLERPAFLEGAVASGVLASRCASHVGRLLMGGVSLDPPAPNPGLAFRNTQPGGAGAGWYVAVEIKTADGTIRRWSDEFVTQFPQLVTGGILYYPDAQATKLYFYKDTGGGYGLADTVPLRPSATHNAAFAVKTVVGSGAAGAAIPIEAVRDEDDATLDVDPRRCFNSGAGRPYEVRAERLFTVGTSLTDGVQGIAPLAAPVSDGQFGEFPLVILCRASITTLGVSEEGEVVSRRLLTAARGCVGPRAFDTDGQRLYYVSDDGLFTVGSDVNHSALLFGPENAGAGSSRPPAGVRFLMAPDTLSALGLYADGVRREAWVISGTLDADGDATARRAWVLDLNSSAPRWTSLARPRRSVVRLGGAVEEHGALMTLDAGGLWREDGQGVIDDSADAIERPVMVTQTVPVSGGERVRLRRLGAEGDYAASINIDVVEYRRVAELPGELPSREATTLASLTLLPERGREANAPAHIARPAFRVRLADGEATRTGDRFRSLSLTLHGPIRKRRAVTTPT